MLKPEQKLKRLKFWYRAATFAIFLALGVCGFFAWQAEPWSREWWMPMSLAILLIIQMPFLFARVDAQMKEIERTGNVDLIDNVFREHVVDKGDQLNRNQVKTWMWVIPVVLLALIALGLLVLALWATRLGEVVRNVIERIVQGL